MRMAFASNTTRDTVLASDLHTAASFEARFRGLMGRSAIPAGFGLWFPGESSIHMMFMRFPIDAVFLGAEDAGGLRPVISVSAALRPWTGLAAVRGAKGVIELPAGAAAASGTVAGDLVRVEL
jgi:uncharacterized membrane protein (UPF0127 family)